MLVALDRDGVVTICPTGKYILKVEDLTLYPEAGLAIALLQGIGAKVCIVTNQSSIERGDLSLAEYQRMHLKIQAAITDKGGEPIHIFTCPHMSKTKCGCRKPQPALLFAAAGWHHESPFDMTFIGDHWSDVAAAKAIGKSTRAILVGTGRGGSQENWDKFNELDVYPDVCHNGLMDAVEGIIREEAKIGNMAASFDSSIIDRAKAVRDNYTPPMGGLR